MNPSGWLTIEQHRTKSTWIPWLYGLSVGIVAGAMMTTAIVISDKPGVRRQPCLTIDQQTIQPHKTKDL